MSLAPFYPRGNPLTDSMPFTARGGERWLVYVEGVAEARTQRRGRAILPGRRLRFDSAGESRVASELPAGSPFLSESRLQGLLDQSQPVPPPVISTWQPRESPIELRRASEWASRAKQAGSAALAASSRFLSAALDGALSLIARLTAGRGLALPRARPDDQPFAAHGSPVTRRWRGARASHRLGPR